MVKPILVVLVLVIKENLIFGTPRIAPPNPPVTPGYPRTLRNDNCQPSNTGMAEDALSVSSEAHRCSTARWDRGREPTFALNWALPLALGPGSAGAGNRVLSAREAKHSYHSARSEC